jgi:hypothetical protein
MKKIFTLLLIVLFSVCYIKNSSAQIVCPPCPTLFMLKDSINCNNVEVRKSATGAGYTNGTFIVRACTNSRVRYELSVDPNCFPVINYSLLSISGGSMVSFVGNQFVVQWGSGTSGTISILVSTPSGSGSFPCRDTMTLAFALTTSPLAAFTVSPQPACFNNPTNINFNSAGSLNAIGYFWKFGDGFTSTLANPTHPYALPGTYTVTLIVANSPLFNGNPICPTCIDSTQRTVVISNLPPPPITCVATVCAGTTETYCTPAAPCATYAWTVTGGTVPSGITNADCITVKWGTGVPQGTLSLVVTGCASSYCATGNTVTIPIIPTTGVITGNTLVCINTNEMYTLPAWPGTTYAWTLSGGGVFNPFNTNTNSVTINWLTTPGTYTLNCNYYDSALKCGGTASYTVLVRPTLTISGPSTVCEGTTSSLFASRPISIGVPSIWTVPAPNTFTGGPTNINVTWPTPGTYVINATNVTANTVCNTASYTVKVLAKPIISAIVGPDSICPGNPHIYKAVSNQTGLFNWSFSAGAITSLLGVNYDSVQVVWPLTGAYTITVSQTAIPSGCISNSFSKTVFKYPTPIVVGSTSVCADNIETYTITNIATGNFNWFVTPAQFGTIQSGQGTASLVIKWHGNNSPGSSNIVYLHFGVCGSDSIAITINEPTAATITPSGAICAGGLTLSTGATGIFTWAGPIGYIPPAPGAVPSISGINIPGNYTVTIANYNGTGCTVSTNYTVPAVGLPVASISATNVIFYCLPNLPNMNLVAVNAPGYSFIWTLIGTGVVGTGATLPINTLTLGGTYSYYCTVSLGTCTAVSNTITIIIGSCSGGGPGSCPGAITVTSITGCNPFTLAVGVTAPSGATLIGNPAIQHLEDNYIVNSYTTRNYSSIGFKQVRICVDINLPAGGGTCRVCKDTVVNVTAAANFTKIIGCKKVALFDASSVVSPATISSYSWSLGTMPGNFPVPPLVASYNNSTIASPVLTVNQSGSYIITQTIVVGLCVLTHLDTFTIVIPNAQFVVNNSCVGTPVIFNNNVAAPTNFWDFGDASTSYTSPTSHAYGTASTFLITHIVTLANGCKDTIVNPITIVASPTCVITYSTPLVFCNKDSVILKGCPGYTNYQWFKNGIAIPGAIGVNDTVKQTGNYHFTAISGSGCIVKSDTVSVTVNQSPNVAIIAIGSTCLGNAFSVQVPTCLGCTYIWEVDGIGVGTTHIYAGFAGTAPFTVGTHTIKVYVTNALGCTDTMSIVKTFYALPTVSISVVGPMPVCSNNLYTLNASTSAASPSWAWTIGNTGFVLNTTSSLVASANGNYNVQVTDGITGCKATATQQIMKSPELNLFPIGCDTLCDTSKVFLPLQSFNGILTGYNIDWYDFGAPLYLSPIYNGISLPLNTLAIGNHVLSVIVTSPNGCKDTSDVYNLLTKSCNVSLPLKEVILAAKQIGNFGLLNWSAKDEWNNNYFSLERSTNGTNFYAIGQVQSKGNNTGKQFYNFNDPTPLTDIVVYYRIKVVGQNGFTEYSNIVKLFPQKANNELMQILPNVINNNANVFIQSQKQQKVNLLIYSTDGKLVQQQNVNLNDGLNNITLNCSKLALGYYIVTVTTQNNKLTATVIKN